MTWRSDAEAASREVGVDPTYGADAWEAKPGGLILTIYCRRHGHKIASINDSQVKEYNNLQSSGELSGGVDLGVLPRLT